MARVNILGEDGKLAGWFDDDKAILIKENRYWDGRNMAGNTTRRSDTHENLYMTAGGRWVLNRASDWQGVGETYEFIDPAEAKDWLLRNESEDELEKYFGEVEEEVGPAVIGRPEIGAPVNVRLGELQAPVDAWAEAHGVKRAEAIRRLLGEALGASA